MSRAVAPGQGRGEALVLAVLLALFLSLWAWQPGPPEAIGSPARWLGAALLVLAWLAGTLTLQRLRRQRDPAEAGAPAAAGAARPLPASVLTIIHATQTGTAEALALRAVESLRAGGVPARALPMDRVDRSVLAAPRLLFVVATTGDGDAPDAAAGFTRMMAEDDLDLSHAQVGVLALGDSNYRNFCAFGRRLDGWLASRGAVPLFERIEMDDYDPAALRAWEAALRSCGALALDPSAGDGFARWRLVSRRCLNPGSQGAPAWHVELTPEQPGTLDWTAGDIAELRPQGLAARDYSIASLPEDGALHLLVREHRRADGTPGAASSLLCRGAATGTLLDLRIRRNNSFHPPPDGRPLVLVGNGTGMAGLRALMKARVAAGHRCNWLLFGERSPGVDAFYAGDIAGWQAAGFLRGCDLVYSRAGQGYVQDRLREQAQALRAWIADGAAVYVCGSLVGMAQGVDAALRDILGDGAVDALATAGNYRRDVY